MLYLFNSAYRPQYCTNILNTLSVPHGCINKYRYMVNQNVERSIGDKIYNGIETIIVFIDRFHENGYFYHPLRFGQLHRCFEAGDRLLFEIILGDHIYPKDINSFQDIFLDKLSRHNFPKANLEDRKDAHDGLYAIKENSIFFEDEKFYKNDKAWANCIDNISKADAFKSEGNKEYLFSMSSIVGKSDDIQSPIKSGNNIGKFNLTTGEQFNMKVLYKYPIQITDNSRTSNLSMYDEQNNFASESTLNKSINGIFDELNFQFELKSDPNSSNGEIKFKTHNEKDIITYCTDTSILFKIGKSGKEKIFLSIGVLLLFIGAALLGIDFDDLEINHILLKVLFAFIQAAGLLILWYFGRTQ